MRWVTRITNLEEQKKVDTMQLMIKWEILHAELCRINNKRKIERGR